MKSTDLIYKVCLKIIFILDLLWHEWIDNLALRRVYFLESDHYPQRMQELDDIANLQSKPEDPIIAQRPPFVPHPEMREVPPNVSLYSVLYQLPVSLVTFDTDGETQMDRQLVATVNFFNECVPSQPGFTSSVVAATIIPDAARVAKAWTKWYRLEGKLRMVRYIRKIIQTKLTKLEEGKTDIYDDVAHALKTSNHTMRTVAEKAYRRVSQTATAASTSISISSSSSTDNKTSTCTTMSVEMTSIGDQEKKPLVASSSLSHDEEDGLLQGDPLLPLIDNNDAASQKTATEQSGFDSDDDHEADNNNNENEDDDDSDEKDERSFWQNVFGGGWRKDEAAYIDDDDDDDDDAENDNDNTIEISEEFVEGSFIEAGVGDIEMQASSEQALVVPADISTSTDSSYYLPSEDNKEVSGGKFYGATSNGFKYENYDVKQYAKTISHSEETELIDIVDGLGIEELSVFAREYAQSSSSPCLLGCSPKLLKIMDIEELREIEEDLFDAIKILNDELIEAREYVVKQDDDFEVDSTMISTASFDSDGERGGSSSSITSDSNSDILMDSPKSRRSGLCQLRNRIVGAAGASATNQWEKAQGVASSMKEIPESTFAKRIGGRLSSSKYALACCKYNPCFGETLKSIPKYYGHMKGAGKAFVTALDHPSYAVITFSSRQAAIAARQCLADGGTNNSWQQIDDIPIPPLADAPPRNICFCRGFW